MSVEVGEGSGGDIVPEAVERQLSDSETLTHTIA